MDSTARHTPLYAEHVKSGARIVDFAGWAMPVTYGGILDETRAVRSAVGIFDISHMGRVRLHGAGSTDLLQRITTNDVTALSESRAQYSLLANPAGGIVDDIIVYRTGGAEYMVVINAGNAAKDLDWVRSHAGGEARLEDRSEQTAMIAIQGPEAPALTARLTGDDGVLQIGRFHCARAVIAGAEALLCRTGYTGEDGFEAIVAADKAGSVWSALLSAGAVPCGLGSRDVLRIEAGYPLYGHEIDDVTGPVEAGLMWVVSLDKGDFIGREAITRVQSEGATRRLVGLVLNDRMAPRQGYTVLRGEEAIGTVTSGVFSPGRGASVAMAYLTAATARMGDTVEVAIREKRVPALVTPKKRLREA
jgi:aminomethyltransferase